MRTIAINDALDDTPVLEGRTVNHTFASLALALLSITGPASADSVSDAANGIEVTKMALGSGTPAMSTSGTETARLVGDGLYHVPNYLPGFPTAATIWPRALSLSCEPESAEDKLTCDGFQVIPALGRGEYIFVRPERKLLPVIVTVPAPAPAPAPIEVTHKKPRG
ncbi:hypothetical protein QN362_01210 [Actimicrobium sp. CCC2.4]|uniref:hypothetical protein n=1 Tax=Actimicrobium sp. CCC2.4 TaxID=3048606 RepID=UPI002AC8B846|nr:hypothetical protein [Actimicrobium sp. CCC2.4]MEB0133942.1 hypothetical protein [Actimicrobium sp. CCC2.4]WPX31482.1 hypothetical protein RHM62_14690 [Actimicrobium sp. CCC2.4]